MKESKNGIHSPYTLFLMQEERCHQSSSLKTDVSTTSAQPHLQQLSNSHSSKESEYNHNLTHLDAQTMKFCYLNQSSISDHVLSFLRPTISCPIQQTYPPLESQQVQQKIQYVNQTDTQSQSNTQVQTTQQGIGIQKQRMGKTTDRIYYNTEKISFGWKYWQSTFYMIGSTCFLLGSIIYFPDFYNWLDAALWGDIFFIMGSSCYFMAEVREWRHHYNFACQEMDEQLDDQQKFVFRERKRYNRYFFIYMLGNCLYLIGCVFCIPSLDRYYLGIQLFLSGFGLLVCIEIHKFIMLLLDKQSICQQIRVDHARAIMEIGGAISEWSYFSGTLLFQWTDIEFLGIYLSTWGVVLYVIGGCASCVYSIIYFKKLLQLQRERQRDSEHSLLTSNESGSLRSQQKLSQNSVQKATAVATQQQTSQS